MKSRQFRFAALQFLAYVAFSLSMSNFIPYMASLAYDSLERGLALSACAVLTIGFQALAGLLSDRFQTIKSLSLVILGFFGLFTLWLFSQSQQVFLQCLLLVGVCGGLINTLCGLIDTWIMSGGPAMASRLSRLKVFGSLGWTVGSLLSSVVIAYAGFSGVGGLSLLFVGLALLVSRALPEMTNKTQSAKSSGGLKPLLANGPYMTLVVVLFVLYGLVMVNTGLVVDKMLVLGASQLEVSLKWAMGSLLEIPMYIYSMSLVKRFGHVKLLIFSSLILMIQCFGFALVQTPSLIILLSCLQVFSTPIILISSKFMVAQLVPAHLQNSGQMLAMSIYIGGASLLVPTLSGFLVGQLGYDLTLYVYAGLAVVGSLVLMSRRQVFVAK